MVKKIRKRDGAVADFEPKKVVDAVYRAFSSVGKADVKVAEKVAGEAVSLLSQRFEDRVPGVEDVQDALEEALVRGGYSDAAKAFVLYRWKRMDEAGAGRFLGVTDSMNLGVNATRILRRKYLKKDERGNPAETPAQMFARVAAAVAAPESRYGGDVKKAEEEFYRLMASLEFLPNSTTLMNAGTAVGQLASCFVLPVPDSMDGIFDALKNAAIIHQSGGGTGYSFSRLRPKGDRVKSTMGVASGPLSFMRVFDVAAEVMKKGGRSAGANTAVLSAAHPDITEFITAKSREGAFANFNLAVGVADSFMQALGENDEYPLVNPRSGTPSKWVKAKDVLELAAAIAWKTGEPGLVFLDELNRKNPVPDLGAAEAANPCGEQPLLASEPCFMGAINLNKVVSGKKIDWNKFAKTIRSAVHFLDNSIDASKYPFAQAEKMAKANRKIGLGVMGFADALIKLGIPYDSEKAVKTAEKIAAFLEKEAKKASVELAKKRGSFPNFQKSSWRKKFKRLRNCTTTSICPTCAISLIANASSGMEPLFAVSFTRQVAPGTGLLETNAEFDAIARRRKFHSRQLVEKIAKTGSVQGVKAVPKDVQRLFTTAADAAPEWQVRVQAAFQKHADSAASKTIMLKPSATVEDVKKTFLLAHELKCRGVSVYRMGCRQGDALCVPAAGGEGTVTASLEYSGGRPTGECIF